MISKDVRLYCKVQNVIMSCKTKKQFEIAKKYIQLAERKLSDDWCMKIIELVLVKERELFSK
jgi:hypothetical protein